MASRKEIFIVPRNLRSIGLISCVAIISSIGCTGQKTGGRADLERALSWLPSDTETLLVANGPFWMSNFQVNDEYKNHAVTNEEFDPMIVFGDAKFTPKWPC